MHPVSHLCYLVDVLCHCSKRKLLALFMQQRMERFTLFITVCVCVFVCVDIIVIFKNCTNNIDVLAKITLQSLPHFQVYTFYIRGSPITNLTYQCATCIVPNKSPRQQTGGMQNAAFCQVHVHVYVLSVNSRIECSCFSDIAHSCRDHTNSLFYHIHIYALSHAHTLYGRVNTNACVTHCSILHNTLTS